MYLNPPCNDIQELNEGIKNGRIFRVFKRWVNPINRDGSYKRSGTSRVTLQDGTDVTVKIEKGKVVSGEVTGMPSVYEPITIPVRMEVTQQTQDQGSFRALLQHGRDVEKKIQAAPYDEWTVEAVNKFFNN